MEKLAAYLNELEKAIPYKTSINRVVSQKEVAWHIDHSLKVIYSVTALLKKSDPNMYRWQFNTNRSFVFLTGYIPRGKGKAPLSVQTFDEISEEDLKTQLEQARISLQELEKLAPKHNFKHPYFGVLNQKQSIKFLRLHTYHHLKIIRECL